MNPAIIDADTADAAREFISHALGPIATSVSTEIQDDGEFLVVTIAQSPSGADATPRILEVATTILTALVPPRSGVYAWKVNIERASAPSFTH